MNKRGILAIISGFSGAGKGTVVNKLLEKDNQELTSICIRLGKVKYRKKIN